MTSRRPSVHGPPARRAFSLVEALVALTIMALAGSVLLLSVESALDSASEAVDRTIADGIAQQVLDQILTEKFAEAASGSGPLAEVLGAIGAAADELLGGGFELFDDVDDYDGYDRRPAQGEYGEQLGTGDDAGGLRLANFRVPSGFFKNWRVRVEVYDVDPSNHSVQSSTVTAYRGIEVFVEKLTPAGTAIPLANRKRIICYVSPPAS